MNSINGIGGANPVDPIESDRNRITKQSSAPPAAGSAASVNFSKPGELFSKLQQLETQDPEKLKEVAGNIAESLRKAAAQAGASGGFLDQLASHFDEVAKTGDLSAIQPKAGGSSPGAISGHHGHHHGHHGGRSSDVATALQNAVDQVDQALTPSTTLPPPAPAAST